MSVLNSLEDVTSSWLTQALASGGALSYGRVESFEIVGRQDRELSTGAQLRLRYTPDSLGTPPASLFLKIVNTAYDDDDPLLASEVEFYGRDYADAKDAPIARCYHSERSKDGSRYHLLLEDLGETHVMVHEKAPTLALAEVFAESSASLHAHWWGAERLAKGGFAVHDPQHIKQFAEIAQPGSEFILASCSDELAPHWPDFIRAIFEHHPLLLIERAEDHSGFTLVHGDLSPGNILVPRDGYRPMYFIDRAPFTWSLTTWLAAYDLCYAMVLYWDTGDRRALEEPVLRRYLAKLVELGVEGYTWQHLFYDYRLTVPMAVYVATEWCRGGLNLQTKRYWMLMLRRALIACDDLKCASLFA